MAENPEIAKLEALSYSILQFGMIKNQLENLIDTMQYHKFSDYQMHNTIIANFEDFELNPPFKALPNGVADNFRTAVAEYKLTDATKYQPEDLIKELDKKAKNLEQQREEQIYKIETALKNGELELRPQEKITFLWNKARSLDKDGEFSCNDYENFKDIAVKIGADFSINGDIINYEIPNQITSTKNSNWVSPSSELIEFLNSNKSPSR